MRGSALRASNRLCDSYELVCATSLLQQFHLACLFPGQGYGNEYMALLLQKCLSTRFSFQIEAGV